ncbi:hypothetical protein PV721_05025 [Streptomyces sp. MB09-01]|uniref:hypothetical protein n=1 Tax=Streptomyces sp. MB09-01 TaxID=3028666 RepID=UPI00299FCB37|nr:hypothetical protein [Streptomyces sp. MB09-01]MDX3533736.1 hypothetical protein [Streptomyces sp. MB09-01]
MGGGRLAFAAGDLVHIRRNDYRSRRDESDAEDTMVTDELARIPAARTARPPSWTMHRR